MTDDATFPARHAGVDHRPDLGAALDGCINSVLSTVAICSAPSRMIKLLIGASRRGRLCAGARDWFTRLPVRLVGGPTVGAPVVINALLVERAAAQRLVPA